MDLEEKKSPIPLIAGVTVLGAVVIGGALLLASQGEENANTPNDESSETSNIAQDTSTQNPPVEDNQQELEISYADGEYTATGTYTSPAGEEEVIVTLTLENEIVTAVRVSPQATNPISVKMQGDFSTGISDVIVGKNIDEIEYPGNVNGSSLTGNGFVEAVESIKTEATV